MTGRTTAPIPRVPIRARIVSSDPNGLVTAAALAAAGHDVVLADVDGTCLGLPSTVRVRGRVVSPVTPASAEPSHSVNLVFAEGEDVEGGMSRLIADDPTAVNVVVGGGIAGAIAAIRVARRAGIPASRVCIVSGFYFGGGREGALVAVDSEKEGMISGFAADPTVEDERAVRACLPRLCLYDARSAALAGLNPVLHVPGMILNAGAIERGERLGFYREAFGDRVAALAQDLDDDRLRVAAALGVRLPAAVQMLDDYYRSDGIRGATLHERVTTFTGYETTRLPDTFSHRFLLHEVVGTLIPLVTAGQAIGVDVSATRACVRIAELLVGRRLDSDVTESEVLDFLVRRG